AFGFDKTDGAAVHPAGRAGTDGLPSWARVFTPEGLEMIGANPAADAMVVPSVIDDAAVVGFHLASRARFEAWLARISHGESRRVEIAGEQASVFGPSRDVHHLPFAASGGVLPDRRLFGIGSDAGPSDSGRPFFA